jgi:hypothetical protein
MGRASLCSFIVAFSSALAVAAPVGASPSADHNRGFAQADADSLIASAALPADATPLDGEPADDGGSLATAQLAGSPNVVARTTWFRSASSVSDVSDFIAAHPPAGTSLLFSNTANASDGHPYAVRGYSRPRVFHELSWRVVAFTVARLDDGSTGILVEAQVVWLTPRSDSELIPATTRDLTLDGRRHVHITDTARVRRIVTILNALDFLEPGVVVCPDRLPAYPLPTLVFRARPRGRVLAVARVEPLDCAQARLEMGGAALAALDLISPPGERLVKLLTKLGLISP